MTHLADLEKSKFLGSGGSMVAKLKLKRIDGRTHKKWSLWPNLTTRETLLGQDTFRIDRLRALS